MNAAAWTGTLIEELEKERARAAKLDSRSRWFRSKSARLAQRVRELEQEIAQLRTDHRLELQAQRDLLVTARLDVRRLERALAQAERRAA